MNLAKKLGVAAAILLGCGTAKPPLPTVEKVDLERYMGDWYVIAQIPTRFDANAYDAVESYRLDEDGDVDTTFRFRRGGFDQPLRELHSTGYPEDDSNAVWGVRFLWPFKAEYRIIDLAPDYSRVVVGRTKRDSAWIMARTPSLPDAEYGRSVELLREVGYDLSELEKVPQSAAR